MMIIILFGQLLMDLSIVDLLLAELAKHDIEIFSNS